MSRQLWEAVANLSKTRILSLHPFKKTFLVSLANSAHVFAKRIHVLVSHVWQEAEKVLYRIVCLIWRLLICLSDTHGSL